jgi:hypothetical protein
MLPAVEAAHLVEEYLWKYSRVLIEWMEMALPVNSALATDSLDQSEGDAVL